MPPARRGRPGLLILSTPSHVELNAALDPGGERAEAAGKIVEFPERSLPLAGAGDYGESHGGAANLAPAHPPALSSRVATEQTRDRAQTLADPILSVPGDGDKGPTASCAPSSARMPACPGRSRRGAGRAAVSLLLALGVTLSGCAELAGRLGIQEGRDRMTYAKFLARARAGDAESRSLLGFMLFFGEGIPRNRAEAHRWFHAAADQGNLRAQRNLAVMHYLGAGVPRDLAEAERYFRLARENVAAAADAGSPFQVYGSIGEVVERGGARVQTEHRPGEALYVTFCAGCHGLNGVAAYVGSPSFAIGERLERSDAALLRSILNGIGEMPEWGNKLPRGELVDVLRFVRSFPSQHELGILQELRRAPGLYFLFGPMRQNPAAYQPGDEDDVERAIKRRRP